MTEKKAKIVDNVAIVTEKRAAETVDDIAGK
jgi:hypothetical protein